MSKPKQIATHTSVNVLLVNIQNKVNLFSIHYVTRAKIEPVKIVCIVVIENYPSNHLLL